VSISANAASSSTTKIRGFMPPIVSSTGPDVRLRRGLETI